MPVTTLPTFSDTIDDAFVETFFEIRKEVANNVQQANVVSALLKQKGRFMPQNGGKLIERTVKYAVGPNPVDVGKGDVLPEGVPVTETAAFFNFRRATATNIQRDLMDDAENAGEFQIKSYVTKRMQDAIQALKDRYEAHWLRAHVTDESGKAPQGLGDIVPPPATRATGTFGRINRPLTYTTATLSGMTVEPAATGNTWWSPKYGILTAPYDVNLLANMRTFFNYVGGQVKNPNMIVTSQTLMELYEDFGLEAIQVLANQKMLDLGFDVVKFKGADLTWTDSMAAGAVLTDGTNAAYSGLTHAMLFLTAEKIDVVYNPLLYFYLTNFKEIPNSTAKIAHLLCRQTALTDEPRRHGLLYA